jgi:hypothetical protein
MSRYPTYPTFNLPQPMPSNLDPYEEMVWQLHRLPGGITAAIPDFFASLLVEIPTSHCWLLSQNDRLALHADGTLHHGDQPIAHFPAALLAAAESAGISPILLGLLAIASGQIDGDRRLKAALPKVNAAAKDLMLMTVCRLCG